MSCSDGSIVADVMQFTAVYTHLRHADASKKKKDRRMMRLIRRLVLLASLIAATLSGSLATWSSAPTAASVAVASGQSLAVEGFVQGYIG